MMLQVDERPTPLYSSAEHIPCDEMESTPPIKICGAGIFPFFVDAQTQQIYFVLGKERYVAGWRSSSLLSAFEGGFKQQDSDAINNAVREFVEESLGIFLTTEVTMPTLTQELANESYAMRIGVHNTRRNEVHWTYIKEFPAPMGDVCAMFESRRATLCRLNELQNALTGVVAEVERRMPKGKPVNKHHHCVQTGSEGTGCKLPSKTRTSCDGYDIPSTALLDAQQRCLCSYKYNGASNKYSVLAEVGDDSCAMVANNGATPVESDDEEGIEYNDGLVSNAQTASEEDLYTQELQSRAFTIRLQITELLKALPAIVRDGAVQVEYKTMEGGSKSSEQMLDRIRVNAEWLEKQSIHVVSINELALALEHDVETFRPYFRVVLQHTLAQFRSPSASMSSISVFG